MTAGARVVLPFDDGAAAAARRLVHAGLADVAADARLDVELLVSEFVTNAYRHGAAPLSIAVATVTGGVRVEVRDGGRPPAAPTPGWGLRIVATFARGWGLVDEDGATLAWCEVASAEVPARPVGAPR